MKDFIILCSQFLIKYLLRNSLFQVLYTLLGISIEYYYVHIITQIHYDSTTTAMSESKNGYSR